MKNMKILKKRGLILTTAIIMTFIGCGDTEDDKTTPSNTETNTNQENNTNSNEQETVTESKKPLIITMKPIARYNTIIMQRGEYPYNIDWGDGSSDSNIIKAVKHKYPTDDVYTISISGKYPHPNFNCTYSDNLVSVEQWGDMKFTSMSKSFQDCDNVVFNASDTPNLSNVTDMSYMFDSSRHEKSTFNSDISNWDVSHITNMRNMFQNTKQFNQDLSSWNVSNVTDMSYMFSRTKEFNQDITLWNVSHVTDMENMFSVASNFNQDIGRWDVSNVTNMGSMFTSASSFNQDITSWDTSNVERMGGIFAGAKIFNQDISNWDFSKIRTIGIENSNLSTENYSKLLLSLVKQNIHNVGQIQAGTIKYSKESESARFELINSYRWSIIDGGKE